MTTFTVTCPHCGETYEVEAPAKERKPRGQLAGIELTAMSDEQLKREIINAGSVLYKAKQRGASEEVIAKNEARLEAAKAERASRRPEPVVADDAEASPEETDAETAAEV